MDWTGTHSVAYLQVSTLPEAWQWHPILAGGSEEKVEVLGMIPNRELHFRSDVLLGRGSKQILLQAVLPQSFPHVCLNFFQGFKMSFQNSQVRWHDQKIGPDRRKKSLPTFTTASLQNQRIYDINISTLHNQIFTAFSSRTRLFRN